MIRRLLVASAGLALAVFVAAGALGVGFGSAGGGRLAVVAYSAPREAYEQLLEEYGRTAAGAGVRFSRSYGASGEQSRAVAAGLPADVVAFSLEPDVARLVKAGIVAPGWNRDRFRGMVTNSVVVLAVREGNPKRIRGWDDLVRPGIEIVMPNPFTSGGARWNVMAAYGARRASGEAHSEAVRYVERLFANVSVQDKSAREALQTFAGGKGDVLLAYESEALLARSEGLRLDYVVPPQTILVENPIAVTTGGVHAREARAFRDWLRTPPAQRVFARAGYRPVDRTVAHEFVFPRPDVLFTIDAVGGWDAVQERFFDRRTGIVARIERRLGGVR